MYDPYAEFTKNILPNGLEVHSVFWDRPWITGKIIIHSGGREDPIAIPGLAHFVEHMVSENIPDWERNEVERFFDEIGGAISFGSTGYLSTTYRFTIPADRKTFQKTLSIFGAMLLSAHIEKKIENQRNIILSEFHRAYPMTERLDWEMSIHKEIFAGHRLETYNRPLGRIQGINAIRKDHLQCFYDKNYVPANMSLVLVGGIKTKDLLSGFERSPFAKNKEGSRNKIPPVFRKLATPSVGKIVKILPYNSGQAEYEAVWTLPWDFSHYAIDIFRGILNQILFEEIRDKRAISYSVNSGYTNFQNILKYGIVGKIKKESVAIINDVVKTCVADVSSRLDLFNRIKQSFIKSCLMLDHSGSSLVKSSAETLEIYHRIINMEEVLDGLNDVKQKDMTEIAFLLKPERQLDFIAQSKP